MVTPLLFLVIPARGFVFIWPPTRQVNFISILLQEASSGRIETPKKLQGSWFPSTSCWFPQSLLEATFLYCNSEFRLVAYHVSLWETNFGYCKYFEFVSSWFLMHSISTSFDINRYQSRSVQELYVYPSRFESYHHVHSYHSSHLNFSPNLFWDQVCQHQTTQCLDLMLPWIQNWQQRLFLDLKRRNMQFMHKLFGYMLEFMEVNGSTCSFEIIKKKSLKRYISGCLKYTHILSCRGCEHPPGSRQLWGAEVCSLIHPTHSKVMQSGYSSKNWCSSTDWMPNSSLFSSVCSFQKQEITWLPTPKSCWGAKTWRVSLWKCHFHRRPDDGLGELKVKTREI